MNFIRRGPVWGLSSGGRFHFLRGEGCSRIGREEDFAPFFTRLLLRTTRVVSLVLAFYGVVFSATSHLALSDFVCLAFFVFYFTFTCLSSGLLCYLPSHSGMTLPIPLGVQCLHCSSSTCTGVVPNITLFGGCDRVVFFCSEVGARFMVPTLIFNTHQPIKHLLHTSKTAAHTHIIRHG